MAASMDTITMNDLPEEILANIFSFVSDTRTRNYMSLVSRTFLRLERKTRTKLVLRGNARHLHMIPTSFNKVTDLDLSLLSPWGHVLFSSNTTSSDPRLLALRLRDAFPEVSSVTVYARSPITLELLFLVTRWPRLCHVKLVRWHQRPQGLPGSDLAPVFEHCPGLCSLDLSSFYHWTEDLPPVLQANPLTARMLKKLNLLTSSLSEGFKANEIQSITEACPNLEELLLACTFDPRYLGFVGDETLSSIAKNCPKLRLLHLADVSSLSDKRGDPNDEGFTAEDASITNKGLVDFFGGLPLLEELVLDVCKNVRDSSSALEVLNAKCPKLKVLKLGQFHGICMAIGSQLDGIALCQELESLSIKNSADLNDMCLIEIARGCSKLVKFEVQGCKHITEKGVRTMASLLRKTLVHVNISCCLNIDASASLRALEPISDRIKWLHIDCVWDNMVEVSNPARPNYGFDLNEMDGAFALNGNDSDYNIFGSSSIELERIDGVCASNGEDFDYNILGSSGVEVGLEGMDGICASNGNNFEYNIFGSSSVEPAEMDGACTSNGNGFDYNIFESNTLELEEMNQAKKQKRSHSPEGAVDCKANGSLCNRWGNLRYLSLWIEVGELLAPLEMAGLENCPKLEEIRIRIEGDCRERPKPSAKEFGLRTLARYKQLTKMQLDCGDTKGYALTAPSGLMDLSLWERFFLNGIGTLRLNELDYWPPQDEEVNQRSLSLPSSGLLATCQTLTKLFIHGTAHEHFLMMLLGIRNLRDVQLRVDYYPAPENDMSSEMRTGSCSRFEDALNGRVFDH